MESHIGTIIVVAVAILLAVVIGAAVANTNKSVKVGTRDPEDDRDIHGVLVEPAPIWTAPATPNRYESFDENTLNKVYEALEDCGLTQEQMQDAVTQMQNRGILFRETKPV